MSVSVDAAAAEEDSGFNKKKSKQAQFNQRRLPDRQEDQ